MAIKGYKQKVEPPPKIHELKALIDKWREPSLVKVDSRLVVPDTSNRGHSGLSVDHVHLLATMMMKDGFRSRNPEFKKKGHDGKPMQGHDIPVLVRGSPNSEISVESLSYWRSVLDGNEGFDEGFPQIKLSETETGWFTSVGNGHFMQALNLFHLGVNSVFTNQEFVPDPSDVPLMSILNHGVESIVLRAEMPVEERRRLALLLNWTHAYKWGVDANGEVDVRAQACENARYTLFEAQSKNLDSGDLTLKVRLELGLKISDRSKIPDGWNGVAYPKGKEFQHLGLSRPMKRHGKKKPMVSKL